MSEERNQKLPLFDRLGGRIFIALIAEKFCDRLLTDPKLHDAFGAVEWDGLKKVVTDLACELLSGADGAVLPVLADVGRRAPLSQSQFNRAISNLIAALVWAGITRELIEEVLDLVTPLSVHLVRPAPSANGDRA